MGLTSRGPRPSGPRLADAGAGTAPARREHRQPAPQPARAASPASRRRGGPSGWSSPAPGVAGLLMASHHGYTPPRVGPVKPVLAPAGRPQTPVPLDLRARVRSGLAHDPVDRGAQRLIRLGITKSGALQVPCTTTVAGWYTGSPRPGAIGSSVIVGHVDSFTGPGIFYRLHLLHPRNLIYVRQKEGRLAVFRLVSVQQYTERRFRRSRWRPAPTPHCA